jgi:hypothetical protein
MLTDAVALSPVIFVLRKASLKNKTKDPQHVVTKPNGTAAIPDQVITTRTLPLQMPNDISDWRHNLTT